jgi:hypothetical protein
MTNIQFAVPMMRSEGTSHLKPLYFCLTNILGFPRSIRKKKEYPDITSPITPEPHGNLAAPVPPTN